MVFFFNDTATTEIYTLSLHDALPISEALSFPQSETPLAPRGPCASASSAAIRSRSEEHTSELQSRPHLVCRLLLEKKKLSKRLPLCCSKAVFSPTPPSALRGSTPPLP